MIHYVFDDYPPVLSYVAGKSIISVDDFPRWKPPLRSWIRTVPLGGLNAMDSAMITGYTDYRVLLSSSMFQKVPPWIIVVGRTFTFNTLSFPFAEATCFDPISSIEMIINGW